MKDNSNEIVVDNSRIAILPLDTVDNWLLKQGEPTNLSDNELLEIEKLLIDCIHKYNPEQEKQYEELNKINPELELDKQNFIINLKNYKRQYIAMLNENGEKVVWINCFCDNFDINWKKEVVFVLDGGNCYFNLKINLTTKEYFEFMVNGVA